MGSLKPALLNVGGENLDEFKKAISTARQFYAVLCMNLLTFSYGCTSGWPSAALLQLRSAKDTPLDTGVLTISEMGWIASGIGLGGFVANLFFGWLSERTGRKIALYVVVIPEILSWLFIYYARTPFYLIVSRILGGFAGGGVFSLIPLYTSEISDDNVRGVLGSLLVLCCNAGLLFAYICGGYFDYFTIPYLMVPFCVAFILLFARYPDSPSFLLKKKLYDEAEKSFLFYRSIDKYSREAKELFEEYMMSFKESNDGSDKITIKDFKSKSSKKAIIYGIILMALNQFCGCFALITFSASIFQISGSSLSPNSSSIAIGLIQLIGSCFASLLVERAGRKTMMCISSFGTTIGLHCLGLYLMLQTRGINMDSYKFIPLLTFSFTIFLANFGILTLPFMILTEISPPKIRGFTTVLCMAFLWVFLFCAIKYLPIFIESIGLHGAVFIFAFNSLIGAVFILLCIPETKGRSFDEIVKILE